MTVRILPVNITIVPLPPKCPELNPQLDFIEK